MVVVVCVGEDRLYLTVNQQADAAAHWSNDISSYLVNMHSSITLPFTYALSLLPSDHTGVFVFILCIYTHIRGCTTADF